MGWIIILIGLWYSVKSFLNLRMAVLSEDWPTVEGVVIESYVGSYVGSYRRGAKAEYFVEISYRYTVDGIEYKGNRRSYSDSGSSDKLKIEMERGHYPAGKVVKVYYCPENPEESVLRPYEKMDGSFLLPVIVIVIGVGFLLWK